MLQKDRLSDVSSEACHYTQCTLSGTDQVALRPTLQTTVVLHTLRYETSLCGEFLIIQQHVALCNNLLNFLPLIALQTMLSNAKPVRQPDLRGYRRKKVQQIVPQLCMIEELPRPPSPQLSPVLPLNDAALTNAALNNAAPQNGAGPTFVAAASTAVFASVVYLTR